MKKSTIKLIIIFSAVSLLGLVITQLVWVLNAVNIAEEQHDHRADLALDDILTEMVTSNDTSIHFAPTPYGEPSIQTHTTIFEVIDTVLLNRLMVKYVDNHRLNEDYYYAIVKTKDNSILYASNPDIEKYQTRNPNKACLSCLWKEEYFHLELYFPSQRQQTILEMSMWLGTSGIFIIIVILSIATTILAILKQKKISEIKNDFINNMTHEFKTPISTISLAAEVLTNADPASSADRIQKYSRIIYDENLRMRNQVERVLQVALLDKGEFKLKKTEFDLHRLLKYAVQNLCIEKCEEHTTVNYNLNAEDHVVSADNMHITNIIVNLVENAIKYSNGDSIIDIGTVNTDQDIMLSVEDNGIGMSQDKLKFIFDKFYRVPTGNLHDVKGFGLGLYYVKNIVEAHGGQIKVSSELNKGSRFEVYLPLVTA